MPLADIIGNESSQNLIDELLSGVTGMFFIGNKIILISVEKSCS